MFKNALAASLVVFATASAGAAETIRALTAETLSPFSREATADLPGFNVEFMRAVAEEAGYDLEIEYLPWKRAQAVVEKEPGLLLFGATRNEAREEKYDWVTNLLTVSRVFLTVGDPVNSIEEARSLDAIGARSVYKRTLEKAGFDTVQEAETQSNMKKMNAGRIDAVFSVSARAMFVWTKELGLDANDLTIGEETGRSDIWLAASKGYDRQIIADLHAAAERLKADGTYAEIYQRYFGDLPIFDIAYPEKKPTLGES